MKLVPCDLKAIKDAPAFKATKNYELITEFAESDHDCMKVEGWTHSQAYVCTGSLNKAIKRFNKAGIKAVTYKGEVYLVKKK